MNNTICEKCGVMDCKSCQPNSENSQLAFASITNTSNIDNNKQSVFESTNTNTNTNIISTENDDISPYAKGLPTWDIQPPNIRVRRTRR